MRSRLTKARKAALVEAVERFDEAAQAHGWESDQGSASGAYEALVTWKAEKAALLTLIGIS